MKLETLVYDKLKKVIPANASKTVLYVSVADTSYELFFYSRFDANEYRNCYEMAENGLIDAYLLDKVFADIAEMIKSSQLFHNSDMNIFTFILDEGGIRMNIEYFDRNVRIYQIKKEWKETYLTF